jgi:putative transposase
LRYWIDNKGVDKYDLNKYCRVLAKEFSFATELNSQAHSAECAWSAISRFYENCRKVQTRHGASVQGKKGFPRFKKNCRSVEYKTSGWKLLKNRKVITFTDKKGIGGLIVLEES